DGSAGLVEHPTPRVGEDQSVGVVGIARNAQQAEMMSSMADRTQGHQIAGVGAPAVLPVGSGTRRLVVIPTTGLLVPALRTGRAASTASGSPHVHAASYAASVVDPFHGVG